MLPFEALRELRGDRFHRAVNVGRKFSPQKGRNVLLDFFRMTCPDQRRTEAFISGNKPYGQLSHRNSAFALERLQPGELLIGVLAEVRAFRPPSGGKRIDESENPRDDHGHAFGLGRREDVSSRGDVERRAIIGDEH